ncbi:MAG: hypothetical protein QM802_02765 [Agriterribacter sp.]
MRKVSSSVNTFVLSYKNSQVTVSTEDQIKFRVIFPGGRETELSFEIDTAMDLLWTYAGQITCQEAKDIGKLIEEKIM